MPEFMVNVAGELEERFPNHVIRQQGWEAGFRRRIHGGKPYTPVVENAPEQLLFDALGEPLAELPEIVSAFYAGLPASVRRLAGPYRQHQWLALEAMRHVPGFQDFLRQEAETVGPNFALAVWEMSEAGIRSRPERLRIAQDIVTQPRVSLLRNLSGLEQFDDTSLRILMRAPPDDMTVEFVGNLVGLLTCDAARHALLSVGSINLWDLRTLRVLPEWLQQPRLTEIIVWGKVGPSWLAAELTPEILECWPDERRRIAASLRNAEDWPHLSMLLDRWHQRLSGTKAFPEPPIPGNAILQPILTPADLEREGRDMQHCVANYANEVWSRRSYFYRWLGGERATVQLDLRADGHWALVQVLGSGNRVIAQQTWRMIEAMLVRNPARTRPLLETYIAGTAYYDLHKLPARPQPGDRLQLRRDKNNPHDGKAIAVYSASGLKLGYVPAVQNADLAVRLDRGEALHARALSLDGGLFAISIWPGSVADA